MGKIKNLSLRKTIVLYMIISLIISFYLSALIMRIATTVQNNIWWKYVDQEEYFEMAEGDGRRYLPDVPRPHSYEMKEFDYHVSEICDFLQTFTVLIVSVAGSIIAVFLFYKHKLKCPIEELELASRQVGRNNLDFHITYENEDEMGGLCTEDSWQRIINSYGKCLRKKRLCGLPLLMIYVLRYLCWRGIRKCFQNISLKKR
jgi:hypothetical protein